MALSKSPSASVRAFLASIIPAPVWSRSFFTSAAVISPWGGASSLLSGRCWVGPGVPARRVRGVAPRACSGVGAWSRLGRGLGRGVGAVSALVLGARRLGGRRRRSRQRRRPPASARRLGDRSAAAGASAARRLGRGGSRGRGRSLSARRRRGAAAAGASASRSLSGRRRSGGGARGRSGARRSGLAAAPASSSRSHSAIGSSAPSSEPAGSSPVRTPERAIRPSATASAMTRVSRVTERMASSLPGIG